MKHHGNYILLTPEELAVKGEHDFIYRQMCRHKKKASNDKRHREKHRDDWKRFRLW